MKGYFVLFTACCFSFSTFSQTLIPGTLDSIWTIKGLFKANEGLIIAQRDTLNHPYKDSIGLIILRPADSCLYMSNGMSWVRLARYQDVADLKLGALALKDFLATDDVKGLPEFLKAQNLESVSASDHRTTNPLQTERFFRVKAGNENGLIDLNNAPLTSWNEPVNTADTNIVYTITPTSWAGNRPVPSLRMRHPLNTFESAITNNRLLNNDFKILPYQYGWAIEYNGTVECWVGEWSIHKGNAYQDVEGKGNGWGAVSWVGDDLDQGGMRITARNAPEFGIHYGEMSLEKFDGSANGNMHFRLPAENNVYKWTWGARGDSNTAMVLSPDKLQVTNTIETKNLQALTIKADTLKLGSEGHPGIQFNSIIENFPENSTLGHIGWLQYNSAGYNNLAGSIGYFTRSDIATDHVFFTGEGIPKPSMILAGNGNLSVGTSANIYKLNIASDEPVSAKFSGRVKGAPAVSENEFVTLNQLTNFVKAASQQMPLPSRERQAAKPVTAEIQTQAEMIYNSHTASSDGQSSSVKIPHAQSAKPQWWNVQATSLSAANILYVTADDCNIIVHYLTAPPAGIDNLSFNISIKPVVPGKFKFL